MDRVRDTISFGPERPRRPPPRWLFVVGPVALSGVVVAVITAYMLGDHHEPRPARPTAASPTAAPATAVGRPCRPVGWAQNPPVAESLSGLLIDREAVGSGLVRCDRTAVGGPWTAVVRRLDGSLGQHGAVVTFPVGRPTIGWSVGVEGVRGTAETGMVTWPVAGAYARIRGDLSEAELIAIAGHTTVMGGRPTVQPPVGYTMVATGPYRSPTIHELRYGSALVGEQAALGDGLTYTGVTSGGGFEDQLYAVHAETGGSVDGRPAVVSSVFGGNATLAWEPTPGVVAYVGYSGSLLDGNAIAALQRVAGKTRPMNDIQWQATNPQIIDQINQPG
jgi:hypothetical protein